MRLVLALLVAALLTAIPRPAHAQIPISCTNTAVYDASTNGATQLVAASANARIYVCGYVIWSAATANVGLQSGTGTNCGTGTVNLTPAYRIASTTGAGITALGNYQGLSTTLNQALCINSSAGVAVQAMVYYAQY
jgi:hypothetical protein